MSGYRVIGECIRLANIKSRRLVARSYVLLGLSCDRAVRPALAAFNEGCSTSGASSQEGEAWSSVATLFIGMDVSKDRHAVAVADGGRDGEDRFFGEIGSDGGSVRHYVRKLERPGVQLRFCYEAGRRATGFSG